jgi:hypothetical protein
VLSIPSDAKLAISDAVVSNLTVEESFQVAVFILHIGLYCMSPTLLPSASQD